MKFNKILILLRKETIVLLIIFLALLLRTVGLGNHPKGLHADEASFLINSVSIMESGRDEDSNLFPAYFKSLMDEKPALYSYLQIPFFAIFGTTIFASRLPSVLMGLVSLYLTYYLVMKVSKDMNLAIIFLVILTISPWHIMNSRSTQEVIMSFMFSLLSMFCFLKLVSKKKETKIGNRKKYLYYSGFFIFTVFAMYSYHSAKVTLPLFFTTIILYRFFKHKQEGLKEWRDSLVLILLTCIPIIVTLSGATTRFNTIGLFSDDLPKAQVYEFITKTNIKVPILVLRFLYNKPFFYLRYFLDLYFRHFSFDYFFTEGGMSGRYKVPGCGIFHLVELPLIILGLYTIAKDTRHKGLKYL